MARKSAGDSGAAASDAHSRRAPALLSQHRPGRTLLDSLVSAPRLDWLVSVCTTHHFFLPFSSSFFFHFPSPPSISLHPILSLFLSVYLSVCPPLPFPRPHNLWPYSSRWVFELIGKQFRGFRFGWVGSGWLRLCCWWRRRRISYRKGELFLCALICLCWRGVSPSLSLYPPQ